MVETETVDDCVRIRLASGVTNVLNTAVVGALAAAVEDAEKHARGVMLCGGDKFFSNGVDLEWALAQSSAGMREMFLTLGACIVKMLDSSVPIVGVIKGHATGAGMALYVACDYRYGATGRVLIGKPEILIGVPNPYFADQLVRFVAGDFAGSDLIYSGRLVTAEEAQSLNIVHGVDDKQAIESVAWQQLMFLKDLPREAFTETKRMRTGRLCADIREQMSARVARQVEIWNTNEAQSRLHAAAQRLSQR